MPLEALLDVLDWKKKDSRSKGPAYSKRTGLSLSPLAWQFFKLLRASKVLTREEAADALTRLGMPLDMNLDIFMTVCFANDDTVRFNRKEVENWPIDSSTIEFSNLLADTQEKSLFKTDTGHLGIGPPDIKPGDLVCAMSAQTLPVLLREVTEPDGGGSFFEHQGCCYVLGLSDGEPATMVANGELEIQTFDIR
ncbi:hypothetical protein F4860DRAFT_461993 [Xylaria cubensis]|nr:hypothetical protein F4860DRAFT_461993 [Xylaria cubensis]